MKRRLMLSVTLLLLAGCGGVETYYVQQPWGDWARVECRRTGDMTRLADLQRHCEMQAVSAQEANAYR